MGRNEVEPRHTGTIQQGRMKLNQSFTENEINDEL